MMIVKVVKTVIIVVMTVVKKLVEKINKLTILINREIKYQTEKKVRNNQSKLTYALHFCFVCSNTSKNEVRIGTWNVTSSIRKNLKLLKKWKTSALMF